MTPKTYVEPDEKIYEAMRNLLADEPLHMLNLIRFNEEADYKEEEFAVQGWTGQQAYAEYGRHASPIIFGLGGEIAYAGTPQLTLIGPEHEQWDIVIIVKYPDTATYFDLIAHEEYQKHKFHRTAAVADSRLVRVAPTGG